jgi:DNA-binding LacI/PurR family transcriptional regulator
MTTQVEIAAAVGLDVSTVNKILNQVSGPVFRKDTIKLVFDKAKELGYKPRVAGKGTMRRTLETLFPREGHIKTLSVVRSVTVAEVARIRRMLYGEPDFKL